MEDQRDWTIDAVRAAHQRHRKEVISERFPGGVVTLRRGAGSVPPKSDSEAADVEAWERTRREVQRSENGFEAWAQFRNAAELDTRRSRSAALQGKRRRSRDPDHEGPAWELGRAARRTAKRNYAYAREMAHLYGVPFGEDQMRQELGFTDDRDEIG